MVISHTILLEQNMLWIVVGNGRMVLNWCPSFGQNQFTRYVPMYGF